MSDTVGAGGPGIHEIAARLAAGDRDAVAWVYDNTSSDLYRRLRRRYEYPGGPDAADVLQETFLLCLRDEARLLRGFAAGLPAGTPALPSLQHYLWDLACGVASNVRRSVWSRRARPMPEAPLAAAEPPPERSTVARDALERLNGCLRRQGERLYLYFKLRYVDGLAPEEIAAGTGWSKKATYKLRQALNEAVQRCLEQTGLRAEWLAMALLAAILLAASACRQPPPELKVPVVVRGHWEVTVGPAGRLRPRFLGPRAKPGLCFAPPAAADTSRWQAVLTFDGEESPGGLAAAAARAGPTLCFDGAIPSLLACAPRPALLSAAGWWTASTARSAASPAGRSAISRTMRRSTAWRTVSKRWPRPALRSLWTSSSAASTASPVRPAAPSPSPRCATSSSPPIF